MHVVSTYCESGHEQYEAGLRGLQGHRGRGLTEGMDILHGERSEHREVMDERIKLLAGGLAVSAEGSGLRVELYINA